MVCIDFKNIKFHTFLKSYKAMSTYNMKWLPCSFDKTNANHS